MRVFLQPDRAFIAQQGAANLAGIVAQTDADDLETFGMLVAAEPVGEEVGHRVSDRLRVGRFIQFENCVHALSKLWIRQADYDAGAHLWMRAYCGLHLGRIDVGAAAQDHVGEPIAEIEIAVGIEPADVAERFPAVRTALRLGAEIVIGAAGPVGGKKIDLAGLAGRDVIAIGADDAQSRRRRRSCRPSLYARAIRRPK